MVDFMDMDISCFSKMQLGSMGENLELPVPKATFYDMNKRSLSNYFPIAQMMIFGFRI